MAKGAKTARFEENYNMNNPVTSEKFPQRKYETLHEALGLSYLTFSAVLSVSYFLDIFKDIHREKPPSNETPVLKKSVNMDNWVVST